MKKKKNDADKVQKLSSDLSLVYSFHIGLWFHFTFLFFFSRREEAVTARFADCPFSIERSTAICFLFLSWRFSATQTFQKCQFSVAPSTATRAHNIGVSIGFQ